MIDFNNLIDSYLEREKKQKKIGRYYPSEIGGCLRKVWYSYTKQKETEKEFLKIFEVGNLLHDFIVDVFRSEKTPEVELVSTELPFEIEGEGYTISGRIDDIIIIKVSNKKVLVEVKSTKSVQYNKEPSRQHVMQLQLYLLATGIKEGIILYLEKNTLESKWYSIEFDENVAKKVLGRFKELNEKLTQEKIPGPEARIKKDMNWMCKYCNYREECYEETPTKVLP